MSRQKTFIYNPILVGMLVIFNISVFGQIAHTLYIRFFTTPVSLEEVNYEEDLEGVFVRTPIEKIYGCYAYSSSGRFGSAYSKEYVIDAGSSYYMGLISEKDDLKWTDALMNATFDYADGKLSLMELKKYQYVITGTIRRIPKESLDYYYEFFEDGPVEQALPYYLVINEVGHLQVTAIPIMLAFEIIGSVALLFMIFKDARRRKGLEGF